MPSTFPPLVRGTTTSERVVGGPGKYRGSLLTSGTSTGSPWVNTQPLTPWLGLSRNPSKPARLPEPATMTSSPVSSSAKKTHELAICSSLSMIRRMCCTRVGRSSTSRTTWVMRYSAASSRVWIGEMGAACACRAGRAPAPEATSRPLPAPGPGAPSAAACAPSCRPAACGGDSPGPAESGRNARYSTPASVPAASVTHCLSWKIYSEPASSSSLSARSSASTTSGRNCTPDHRFNSAIACSSETAGRYGRPVVMVSKASATEMMAAPSGIASPASPSG